MTTLEQFLILSWMIWKARNKWVFKQSTEQPSVVAGEAIEFWQEFQAICNSGSSTTHRNPPNNSRIKSHTASESLGINLTQVLVLLRY